MVIGTSSASGLSRSSIMRWKRSWSLRTAPQIVGRTSGSFSFVMMLNFYFRMASARPIKEGSRFAASARARMGSGSAGSPPIAPRTRGRLGPAPGPRNRAAPRGPGSGVPSRAASEPGLESPPSPDPSFPSFPSGARSNRPWNRATPKTPHEIRRRKAGREPRPRGRRASP